MATRNRIITLSFCCLFIAQLTIGAADGNSQFTTARMLSTTSAKDTDSSKTKDDAPSSSKVDINYNSLDSELIDIMWCGEETKNILVLTSKGTVYQTNDQGKNWNKLRETFQRTGKREISGDEDVISFFF